MADQERQMNVQCLEIQLFREYRHRLAKSNLNLTSDGSGLGVVEFDNLIQFKWTNLKLKLLADETMNTDDQLICLMQKMDNFT